MSPHRIFGSPADKAQICPICGALIGKPKRHRKWHKQVERRNDASQ